ncbi:hypothetical protein LTR56_021323 [Elasticomyces elasticus]|nr:hypothetical protein LTR56_021323 [Elasticomyces elasticus]KAK3662187.1 hypothetical protein LTR22_006952 [Elasticomyces elasticus]KAK4916165.1 hypothetical protein LTR49_015806 [Elasticomyces elasticus]KAK5767951.1 hypothetical protein LTS12_001768 [Elasticomyces elasticus]
MPTTSQTNEYPPIPTTRPNPSSIFRTFSKSLRRNATVSALQPPTQPPSTHSHPTHELHTHEFHTLSSDLITLRLRLQNSHLALLAKDREIANLHYWLNGRGQQTGDLVFRIGELMILGQEAESELVDLETEFDELKEVLGKAVKEVLQSREVLRLREVVEGKGGVKGEGEGGDAVGEKKSVVFAEALRLEAVVDAARLYVRHQDQHLEDLEAKIKRDGKKMLELETHSDERWRYALGVEEDLKIAETDNDKLKAANEELEEENEVLKAKWEVGSEEYLKLKRECNRERKGKVRAERRLAKRISGRRRRIAVDNVAERADESDDWEDFVDDEECEGAWF